MKQILKLFGSQMISRPVGLLLALVICSVAATQLMILSEIYFSSSKASFIPESMRNMMVFVRGKPSAEKLTGLEADLKKTIGVEKIEHISRDSGLKKLRGWLGEESPVISGLDSGVLPDAYSVTLRESDIKIVDKIVSDIMKFGDVETVKYSRELMYRTDAFISRTKVLLQTVLYIYAGCLCLLIFCVMKLRLGKKSNSACRPSSMATWNMAIFLEGISCILIFSFAGRYLVTVAANEACAILPEISRLLPFSSLQPVLTGIGISAFFGIAGTILSLKVEE